MSKEKDKFSEKSNYTLDDILAEYDNNQNNKAASPEETASNTENVDLTVDSDITKTENDNNDNIEQAFDEPIEHEHVINNICAVPTFEDIDADSVDVVIETDLEKPFEMAELSDKDIDEIENALSSFTANMPAEFTAPTAENIADSVVGFKEILEDEDVPEELANLPVEDGEIIYADEEQIVVDAPSEDKQLDDTASDISEDVNIVWWKKLAKTLFPAKGDGALEIVRKIIFLCASIVFIGAGVMLTSTLVQSHRAIKDLDELRSMVATTVVTSIDAQGNTVTIAPTEDEVIEHNYNLMQNLHERFENIVAFIEMPACDISYPVVQAEDNDYYLNHTYYDAVNKAGAIFLDYRSTLTADYTSPNLVLYGHNQSDGTMFGNLKYFKKDENGKVDFYKKNPEITPVNRKRVCPARAEQTLFYPIP